jgi:hypothetical protein
MCPALHRTLLALKVFLLISLESRPFDMLWFEYVGNIGVN